MPLHEMLIPNPGESISEVEIGNWLKKSGDYVKVDDPLCEIETDKATLPLPAEAAGKLEIVLEQGVTAAVGEVICRIDTDSKPLETLLAAAEEGNQSSELAEQTTAEIEEVFDEVEKIVQESGVDGIYLKEGTVMNARYAQGYPSPAARKMMDEQDLSPDTIQGGGPGGRILKEDVQRQISVSDSARAEPEDKPDTEPLPAPAGPKTPPRFTLLRGLKRQKMSRLRRKLSERLVAVKNETAMLTTFNEVDMQAIFDLRKLYRDDFEKKHGVRLGFMGFFVKACCEALQEFPNVNSQIEGEEMVSFDYVDIGIAVSAPKGLMVPVIRNAEGLEILKHLKIQEKLA